MVKFSLYSKLVLVILTLHRRGKLLEHFISIVYSCITFKYFAFLSVCDKYELLGHVQAAMDDLSVIFAVLSCIHCRLLWLLLAVLSDYFGQLVTSTLLLYRFRGLPGFTPVSFLVMRRWNCLGMKRSSQPSSTLLRPGKGAEKTRQSVNRCEASNAKFRKNSILNRKR